MAQTPILPSITPRPTGAFERGEDTLIQHRAKLLWFFAALLVINVGYWVLTNAINAAYGSKGAWWVESTTTAATIGLAFGTVALAAAAFVQARAAADQSTVGLAQLALLGAQVDSAKALAEAAKSQNSAIQAASIAQHRPNLSLEVVGASVLASQSSDIRTLVPGDLIAIGEEDRMFHLSNTGPGVAREVKVQVLGFLPNEKDHKVISSSQVTKSVLGPGQRSQVTFPIPLASELWPNTEIGEKFAIVLWVEAMPAWPVDEDGSAWEELNCGAVGGVLAESVERSDNGQVGYAWRVLSDTDCSRLINREIQAKDLPSVIGSAGRRHARFGQAGIKAA